MRADSPLALRFSIITPTFNRRDMLSEALDSVSRQDWPEVEHIVVDGGSTDGTLELVTSRPTLRLIGGPDKGVYDALNKGIAAATGEIVCFLNSDDVFEPGALKAAAEGFSGGSTCDSVCGEARLVAGSETIEVYDRDEDKRLTSARTALLGASIINARLLPQSCARQGRPLFARLWDRFGPGLSYAGDHTRFADGAYFGPRLHLSASPRFALLLGGGGPAPRHLAGAFRRCASMVAAGRGNARDKKHRPGARGTLPRPACAERAARREARRCVAAHRGWRARDARQSRCDRTRACRRHRR